VDRKGEVGRVERGANLPADRRSKLGVPMVDIPDIRRMPVSPQMPRVSARDRLFKLMLAARPKPIVRPRPPSLAAPSPPIRNAIGIRIDPSQAARTASTTHWGQRPPYAATAGTTSMAARATGANAWNPGAATAGPPAPGALNGTTSIRVRSGMAVIGGPAPVVTGINGTTLRSKHP
jgi:hypothetical protein